MEGTASIYQPQAYHKKASCSNHLAPRILLWKAQRDQAPRLAFSRGNR